MSDLAILVKALETAIAQMKGEDVKKAISNTNQAQLLTQPGGLFNVVGINNEVINAAAMPTGLGRYMPWVPNNLTDPRYGLLMGYQASVGNRPTYPCDDAPTGVVKFGTLTSQFGRISHQTKDIEVDALMEEARGSGTNLRLIGASMGDPNVDPSRLSDGQILDLVVASEMKSVGIGFQRDMTQLLWQGDPSNNTAGGGYKEFPGLDSQIATGQVDAETGVAINAADSYIRDFGYNDVSGSDADIVLALSAMEAYLVNKAQRTGLSPVTWKVVMRPELWHVISTIWPCRYMTDRCGNAAGTPLVVINDNTAVQERDAMRNGQYIFINGTRYDVVTDDGMYEKDHVTTAASIPAGEFASSIAFVPMTITGGFPVTYWEYKSYTGVPTQISPMREGAQMARFWTDGGKFMWVFRDIGFCFNLQAKMEPRAILRVPQLAGRLDNVRYYIDTHFDSPYPASPYFKDGGFSGTTATKAYAVWK
mgnify:CR=1 FL=1